MAFLTGQSWRVFKSWTQAGAQNKDFATDSQADLSRSLVPPPPEFHLWRRLCLSLLLFTAEYRYTEFNYSVHAKIVPNRLKFASFSYFQVNLPKLTWLIFLSHSKYDTVTPPAFKYKSCKIRISLKGASRRSINYMRKTISQSIFSHWNCFSLAVATHDKDGHALKLEKNLANFPSFNVTPAKITKWLMVSAPPGCSPDDIFFITLDEYFAYGKLKGWWRNDFSSAWT